MARRQLQYYKRNHSTVKKTTILESSGIDSWTPAGIASRLLINFKVRSRIVLCRSTVLVNSLKLGRPKGLLFWTLNYFSKGV